MSTPQLSYKHFADVYVSLEWFANIGNRGNGEECSDTFKSTLRHALNPQLREDGDDFEAVRETLKELVTRWAQINAAAANARYAGRHGYDGEIEPIAFHHGKRLTLVELFKAMQCIAYNCDGAESSPEDEMQEAHALLQTLTEKVAAYIVMRLPAYSKAEWFR